MKTIYLSLISIFLLASCSNTDATKNIEENEPKTKDQEKIVEIETEPTTKAETAATKGDFELIIPDTTTLKAKWIADDYSSSLAYRYLTEYYHPKSEKENTDYYGDGDYMCQFTQNFDYNISYSLSGCGEGGGNVEIIEIPKTDIKIVKEFITKLFFDPYSTWYSANEYGPQDAGCTYTLKESETTTIIHIYCGC